MTDNLFRRLSAGLDVKPLLAALDAHPELWGMVTARQDFPGSAHHDTECVFLRWAADQSMEAAFRDLDAVWLPMPGDVWQALFNLLLVAMPPQSLQQLGRVILPKLKPGGVIDLHTDEGAYAEHYQRFHISLQSDEGNSFTVGGESFHALPGELWWFNHRQPHTVSNASARPRLHLIVDAIPC